MESDESRQLSALNRFHKALAVQELSQAEKKIDIKAA